MLRLKTVRYTMVHHKIVCIRLYSYRKVHSHETVHVTKQYVAIRTVTEGTVRYKTVHKHYLRNITVHYRTG
jgi:hypothetical protein